MSLYIQGNERVAVTGQHCSRSLSIIYYVMTSWISLCCVELMLWCAIFYVLYWPACFSWGFLLSFLQPLKLCWYCFEGSVKYELECVPSAARRGPTCGFLPAFTLLPPHWAHCHELQIFALPEVTFLGHYRMPERFQIVSIFRKHKKIKKTYSPIWQYILYTVPLEGHSKNSNAAICMQHNVTKWKKYCIFNLR